MGCSPSQGLDNRTDKVRFSQSFTEQEKIIVKQQWRTLSPDTKEIGAKVFMEIFKKYPEVKQMFPFRNTPDDRLVSSKVFNAHAVIFMRAIGAVVENIDDVENAMSNALIFLGKQHVAFTGMDQFYFDEFTCVISNVWREKLGASYTSDSARAWRHVFVYIMGKLKKGYMYHIA